MKKALSFVLAALSIMSCFVFLSGCKKKGDSSSSDSSPDDAYMTAADAILKIKEHINAGGEDKFAAGEIDKVTPEITYKNTGVVISYDSCMDLDNKRFWVFSEYAVSEVQQNSSELEKVNWYNVNAETGEVIPKINLDGSENSNYTSL